MIHRKTFSFTNNEVSYIIDDETIKRRLCLDIINEISMEELEKIFAFKRLHTFKENINVIEASINTSMIDQC